MLQSEQPLCLTARLDSQNDAADNRDMGDEEEDAPRELKLLGQSVRPLAEACGDSDTPCACRYRRTAWVGKIC